jgi:alkylated DNA nucleotide flippase Atl1
VPDVKRLMYVVDGPTAKPAVRISLEEAKLREVQDLQEWVLTHPEVLGADVMIVTSEFNKWSSESGATAKERLDVLGLDATGRLVVVELKRDSDRFVHIQALTYAALVSGFTEDALASVHADWSSKRGRPTDPERALELLRDHADGPLDLGILSAPRIVLVAGQFLPQVITSAVYMTRFKMDIELREVTAYRLGEQVAVTFDLVYPPQGVDAMLLAPAQREATEAATKVAEKSRAEAATKVIFDKGLLDPGTPLRLVATTEVTENVRADVQAWVEQDPTRGVGQWNNDPVRAIRWEHDGVLYRPGTLVRRILKEAAGLERGVRATSWWLIDGSSQSLADVAFGKGGRDWSDVHALISVVGPGHWTSYGDIAQVVGLPALAIGQHISSCASCPHGAHRVLMQGGSPSDGFHWGAPDDDRDLREVLAGEGLTFDANGKALPEQHLAAGELTAALREGGDMAATNIADSFETARSNSGDGRAM